VIPGPSDFGRSVRMNYATFLYDSLSVYLFPPQWQIDSACGEHMGSLI
jgi:hypothetical protein